MFTTQHNKFKIDMHDLKFLSTFPTIPNAWFSYSRKTGKGGS